MLKEDGHSNIDEEGIGKSGKNAKDGFLSQTHELHDRVPKAAMRIGIFRPTRTFLVHPLSP